MGKKCRSKSASSATVATERARLASKLIEQRVKSILGLGAALGGRPPDPRGALRVPRRPARALAARGVPPRRATRPRGTDRCLPPSAPRTDRTRRVPPPVLIGHAAAIHGPASAHRAMHGTPSRPPPPPGAPAGERRGDSRDVAGRRAARHPRGGPRALRAQVHRRRRRGAPAPLPVLVKHRLGTGQMRSGR